MNENIFISIVIPNLNQGKFLSQCIDSILDQKFNSFEIIIIDSYSVDESDKIIKKYLKKIKKKLIYIRKKCGQAEAINYGFKIAKGKFLAFQAADDYYLKDAFNKFYSFSKKNNYANIIYGNLEFRNLNNKFLRPLNFNFVNRFSLSYEGMVVSNQSTIFKKTLLNKYGYILDMRQSFDLEFWLRLSEEKYFKLDTEKPVAVFRIHSRQKSKFYNFYDNTLRQIMLENYEKKSYFYFLSKNFLRSISRFCRFCIHLKKGQFKYIFLYFKKKNF